jgi:hypothetical protein
MRWLLPVLLLSAGCSDPFGTERAAQAKRIEALEKQVAELSMKAADKASEAADSRRGMELCFADADAAYWSVIELNGRKKPGSEKLPNGPIWTAPQHTWDLAATKKRLALEECRIKYARN